MLKIFLTDLAAYNNGYLVGEWLTLPLETEELEANIKEILAKGEELCGDRFSDEFFITDYEWEDVSIFSVDEYENIYTLNEKIKLIEESIEPWQHRIVKVLLDNGLVNTLEDAIDKVDEVVVYENSTMADIVEQYIEEYTDLNAYHPLIVAHIDYEGIGRDLELEGNFFRENSDIFQFLG